MKDFLSDVGDVKVYGSKDATKEAFNQGLIQNGELWMEMIRSRNKTSHTYNKETANDIYFKIMSIYYSEFMAFQRIMENKRSDEQTKMF